MRRFDLGAWPIKKQYNKKVTKVSYFPYLGGSPRWADSILKLHDGWCPRRNHVCRVSNWNLHGVKFSFSYWFLHGPYNSAALMRRVPVITQANRNRSVPNSVHIKRSLDDNVQDILGVFGAVAVTVKRGVGRVPRSQIFLCGILRLIFRQLSHKIWRLGD